jgi:hypothetical protein
LYNSINYSLKNTLTNTCISKITRFGPFHPKQPESAQEGCNRMPEYTKEDLEEAIRAIQSTIARCQKVLPKLKAAPVQRTLLVRRIRALPIASELIARASARNTTKHAQTRNGIALAQGYFILILRGTHSPPIPVACIVCGAGSSPQIPKLPFPACFYPPKECKLL